MVFRSAFDEPAFIVNSAGRLSGDRTHTVKASGFYDLIPPGDIGNEAGIIANVPAAQARPGFKRPDR